MILARVVGTVVATRKDERLLGRKLLVCRPVAPDGAPEGTNYMVAVDTVGAGYQETVLLVSGSSARMAGGFKESPVDNAIVGIVDAIELDAEARETREPAAVASKVQRVAPEPQSKPAANSKRAAAATRSRR
jgi:ethanolamine utilization protein EutN